MLNRKAIATGLLITMFGGFSTALWGAFREITTLSVKSKTIEKRLNRVEHRNEKRLERIENKLDQIRGLL